MSLTGANAEVRLTERDLLRLKLALLGIGSRSSEWGFSFDVGLGVITCRIASPSTSRMLKEGTETALTYFKAWINAVQLQVQSVVAELPSLRETFKPDEDMRFEIVDDYGKGAVLICTFADGEVKWNI